MTWQKIGTQSKHLANMYGKKGEKNVIYIDNWDKGNYAVILGIEKGGKTTSNGMTHLIPPYYVEKETLGNFGTRQVAIKFMKEYIKTH